MSAKNTPQTSWTGWRLPKLVVKTQSLTISPQRHTSSNSRSRHSNEQTTRYTTTKHQGLSWWYSNCLRLFLTSSRQTIDTFQAASVFLELMSIWSPLDPETTAKIKYAKYHALRIAKAIKAGEDPNASNPVQEDEAGADINITTPGASAVLPSGASGIYRPPTVESAPESKQPSRPSSIAQATPLAQPPIYSASTGIGTATDNPYVSPLESEEAGTARQGSVGGGYFPSVPTSTSEAAAPSLPTAAPDVPYVDNSMSDTNEFNTSSVATNAITPDPTSFYIQQPSQPPPLSSHFAQPRTPAAMPPPPVPSAAIPAPVSAHGPYRTDDEAVAQAQKHAKWAMSALNFEDVPTAVKELRIALQSLGAL